MSAPTCTLYNRPAAWRVGDELISIAPLLDARENLVRRRKALELEEFSSPTLTVSLTFRLSRTLA